jgi:hypothetical protein
MNHQAYTCGRNFKSVFRAWSAHESFKRTSATPKIGGCHDGASKHGEPTTGRMVAGLYNINPVPQEGEMAMGKAKGWKSQEQRLGKLGLGKAQ